MVYSIYRVYHYNYINNNDIVKTEYITVNRTASGTACDFSSYVPSGYKCLTIIPEVDAGSTDTTKIVGLFNYLPAVAIVKTSTNINVKIRANMILRLK